MKQTLMNIECRLIDIETKQDLKAQIVPTLGIATYKMIGIQDLYQVPEVEHASNVSLIIDKFDDDKLMVSSIHKNLISFTNISDKLQTMPRKFKMRVITENGEVNE